MQRLSICAPIFPYAPCPAAQLPWAAPSQGHFPVILPARFFSVPALFVPVGRRFFQLAGQRSADVPAAKQQIAGAPCFEELPQMVPVAVVSLHPAKNSKPAESAGAGRAYPSAPAAGERAWWGAGRLLPGVPPFAA